MANYPNGGGDSLRFCLIARVKYLARSLDEPQLSRKVLFKSIHFGTPCKAETYSCCYCSSVATKCMTEFKPTTEHQSSSLSRLGSAANPIRRMKT
jgi:hypothetical protein